MRPTTIAVMAGVLTATCAAAPVLAEQSQLSTILFGKIYNDNVTTHQIKMSRHDDDGILPSAALYPSKAGVTQAQAEASQDPSLREALALRKIAIHNVIWIQTAASGGKVVYYR